MFTGGFFQWCVSQISSGFSTYWKHAIPFSPFQCQHLLLKRRPFFRGLRRCWDWPISKPCWAHGSVWWRTMRRSGGIDSSPTAWKRCGQKWVYYIYITRGTWYPANDQKWSEMMSMIWVWPEMGCSFHSETWWFLKNDGKAGWIMGTHSTFKLDSGLTISWTVLWTYLSEHQRWRRL